MEATNAGLVVLGSASPRRREILGNLGVPHVVVVAGVDEAVIPGELPDPYLVRIVRAKLDAVRRAIDEGLRPGVAAILVADTSVIVTEADGTPSILGKPGGRDEAVAMIERLAGRTHEVHTRFAIGALDRGPPLHEETVATKVTFRPLLRERVVAYAETGEGLDKAGGYAVQGRGAGLVARIEGSYSCVVGLPACEVAVALERLGLA
jgi:septum formation protein